jgi:hypothetical protein
MQLFFARLYSSPLHPVCSEQLGWLNVRKEPRVGFVDLSLRSGAITLRSGGGVLRARNDSLLRVTDRGPRSSASDHLGRLVWTVKTLKSSDR